MDVSYYFGHVNLACAFPSKSNTDDDLHVDEPHGSLRCSLTINPNRRECSVWTVQPGIGLTTTLLSHFDLLWDIVDRSDDDRDLNLVRHIAHVHQHDTYPELDFKAFSPDFFRDFAVLLLYD